MADGTSAGRNRQAPIRIGAVVALALAVAFIVWLVVRGDDSTTPSATIRTATTSTKPPREFLTAATPAKLRTLARASGHPIYWAGRRANVTYELTQTTDGRIYIRYLPKGVRVGSRNPSVLFVGTYPVENAHAAIKKAAKSAGDVTFRIRRGGTAIYDPNHPTNVYFAYPGSKVQVEVFDPNPARARQLVRSGAIRAIA